ncbi:MAG: hypothetical protein QY323_01565 [Patescibacteria group bacterium]|nr:MAG: hypothetical protein QY323_01565 [Patescibacteria group bacterium]
MPKLDRQKILLIVLIILIAAIVVVLALFVFKPPVVSEAPAYIPPKVDTRIPNDLTERPEYRRLELRVDLPIVPGRMGRENPFAPY